MTLSALRARIYFIRCQNGVTLTIGHNQTAKTVALKMQGATQFINRCLAPAELDQYPFL